MSDHESPALAGMPEAEILERIFPRLPEAQAALLGPGDDAAVLAAADGRYVVTVDMMVHGPDFRLAWSRPADLGWKAAATNLADVAAMGAVPTALVVAIAAPPSTRVDVLEGIADGLRQGCELMAPGCGVVGGDLSASPSLTLSVTAFGDLQGRPPVLRSGARDGHVVALAGETGLAAEGLRLLFEQARSDGVPDPDGVARLRSRHPRALQAQLAPTPPIAAGAEAARAGASAMMDVSDSLALDASRLARASGVDLLLKGSLLDHTGRRLDDILYGGEDHALLATFPPEAPLPAAFRPIGRVAEGRGRVLLDGRPLEPEGWQPYRGWDGAAG